MLKLEFPHESHREMYEDMIEEWGAFEKIPTSPSLLFRGGNFDEFLEDIGKAQRGEIKLQVPSSLFFLLEKEKILGAIDIRHNIEHPKLRDLSGHIGYGVRPSERSKGYATKMLELGLIEAKRLGIQKVLISCHPENIASEKVILNNGGIYDSTIEHGDKIYKRYWIKL